MGNNNKKEVPKDNVSSVANNEPKEIKKESDAPVENETGNSPFPPNTETVAKPSDAKPASMEHANKKPFILRRGEVLVGVLGKDGKEMDGNDFVTNEATATKHYSDATKFIIKKKYN